MSLESQFIPYEEAVSLKELGFNEPCFGFYIGDIIRLSLYTNYPYKNTYVPYDTQDFIVTAILYQQAFEFLLNLLPDVSITYFHDGSGSLRRIGNKTPFYDFNNRKECLIELINQSKTKIMEIYNPTKLELVRLTIKGNCQDTQYLNLINTTHAEVIEFVIKTFSGYMVKSKEFRTTIDIRFCVGGENLNSQRVTLYGIKPSQVSTKIQSQLTK